MLVILKVAILFEARRKSTFGATDAQQNAAIAVSFMLRELRMAGHGLGAIDSLGCSVTHDLGTALGALSLVPVTIMDGSDGVPDEIRIFSGASKQSTSPTSLLTTHAASDTSMQIASNLGIQPGDRLMLYEPGKPCSLIQATAISTGSYRVDHTPMPLVTLTGAGGADSIANPVALDYAAGTQVINLGSLRLVRYESPRKS